MDTFNLFNANGEWLATCGLTVIQIITGCHHDATKRIVRELESGAAEVVLYGNGRGPNFIVRK